MGSTISPSTLDQIFLPYFASLPQGTEVTLVQMNWVYDAQQKSGSLMKAEAEYVVNAQIALGRLQVLAPTRFKVVENVQQQAAYVVTDADVKKAGEKYRKDFWKKYRELSNT